MPEYEFFVSGDAPRPATTAMRSHAMRTALASRSRRLKEPVGQMQIVPGSKESRRTQELKTTLKGRFRLSDKAVSDKDSRRRSKKLAVKKLLPVDPRYSRSPSPDTQDSRLGTRSLDPFGVLPVENNWRVDRLIQYFITKFTLNVSKNAKQRPYFSMAMSEPLVMRGTLALSCTVWAMSVPSVDRAVAYEGLYQKTQAIKEINREIDQFPLGQVSDAMIVAVANLANVVKQETHRDEKAMEGSFAEADMHVRGLKRLVDSRGGAVAFKDTYHVAQAITWVDLQAAAGIGRAPLFPLIRGYMDVHLPQDLLLQADEPSIAHITSEDGDLDNEDVVSVFRCLRQSVLAKKHDVGGPAPTRILHNIADLYILRRIEREPKTPNEYRFRTLCLAAHVFLYAGLRLVPRNGPLVQTLVERLRGALDNRNPVNIAAWPRARLQDLLWVLFVGGVVADERGQGAWFSVRLKAVIRMIGCGSRAEVEELLRRICMGVTGRVEQGSTALHSTKAQH
ncbi:hypothetical protein CONLIGDRAFT_688237 [Coniochaeta ligniaria NRRL 30616]|uniref:Tachykinin family protein n=1 Tax=Coniochaeta ligniaria NRRL 30616 TaxID=1408157 RepID=A0A1J7J2T1_9PEZI|nr:hypothetical protein CONLIGDRAFT_688237 [Coniochaeta ligniaria NRRL 30616]